MPDAGYSKANSKLTIFSAVLSPGKLFTVAAWAR
jgi:hypothetical protein